MNKLKYGIFAFGIISFGLLSFQVVNNRFEVSKNLEIFAAVYKEVDITYVNETKPGELMRTGIDAILSSLDPYTVFYSEAQAEDALTQRTGEYGGLGIYVTKIEEYLVITDVFEGYSAQTNDVKIGDRIIEVEGKNFIGKTNNDLSPVMKGARGTKVKVKLERPGVGIIEKEIERVEVKLKNVTYFGKVNDQIGYLHLTNFMQEAAKEVAEAVNKLKAEGCTSIILDLRNNPGGLLNESVDIVNLFIPKGELVVFTKGRTDADYLEYKTKNMPLDTEIPLTVLINERSASASEIVSGTLQDLDRAVVVGFNSFGKGLVQTTRSLPYRTQMKITTAKYYTPSGRCIQALDYAHKNEDGSVGKVADSLRQAFKSKNGRTVFDGGGILPDMSMDNTGKKEILKKLENSYIIFDFALVYFTKNKPSISATYLIAESAFSEFLSFAESKFDRIPNKSDQQIKLLETQLKEENINSLSAALGQLKQAINQEKIAQINANKQYILQKISLEIIRINGLEKAFYQGQFTKDEATLAAIALLKNKTKYNQILKGN